MTLQELLDEIDRLPLDEQLMLLERLSRHIRETIQVDTKPMQGMLATREAPPTDEEVQADYTDYLDEKYQ